MNVAFIPVRGGSKSIPLKNIKPMCGMPLAYWVVKAACCCVYIDRVFVATDSEEIKNVVEGFKSQAKFKEINKLVVIGRSKESSTDNASTESAMLEFADKYDFNPAEVWNLCIHRMNSDRSIDRILRMKRQDHNTSSSSHDMPCNRS